jgi:hypothetical protein
MQQTTREVSEHAKVLRDPSKKKTDAAALRAIAQAAVEVELFTIPLYMTSMYSIQGMHQITGQNNAFYKDRLWPGPHTTAHPRTANEKAFNCIFSVFIQEMLHLQLAANMATALNAETPPSFSSSALQSSTHGWTCYGPGSSVIPHIIDLKDTKSYSQVAVNIGALSREQLELFIAIEQPEADARADILEDKVHKYFPKVPFADWSEGDPLPRFGTIGWMYQCYFNYLHLRYADGTSLWDEVFNPNGQQNDLFNSFTGSGHPMREFPGFETTIALTYKDIALAQMGHMMDAITDQGEGSEIERKADMLGAEVGVVKARYRPSHAALRSNYPKFTDTGALTESSDAEARFHDGGRDHYERFREILDYIDHVVTWPQWLQKHGKWTAADLEVPGYVAPADSKVPSTEAVAGALNYLAHPDPGAPDYYKLMSQAVIGAIAGVTTVLDSYWSSAAQAKGAVTFPYPSMAGSGDRMAICWAVFGKAPDLSIGLDAPESGALYHACQGLDYTAARPDAGKNQCAPVTLFHTCRGSNNCRAQGGCGFVQPVTGGGSCSAKLSTDTALATRTFASGCNPFAGAAYSAPGDNKCAALGGCAVPISASQLFPKGGRMDLFRFEKNEAGEWHSVPCDQPLFFNVGDNVHDVAWAAYKKVMQLDDSTPAPQATPLRLAFPPST